MGKIQWTERTYNPIAGCSRVSPGCTSCYAERMAKRLQAMGQKKYQGTIDKNGRWTGKINRADDESFNEPLRNKKPTMYFVNSMSDLLHENINVETLTDIFEVMARTPWHTYQVLTKRADRLWLLDHEIAPGVGHRLDKQRLPGFWPLKNVWLGVSIENQDYTDRIDYLLKTPAAVRFLSLEPLLGPIDLSEIQPFKMRKHTGFKATGGILSGFVDWVIVGGESGPGARPCQLDWIRSLVYQCKTACVPVFVKQLGALAVDDNYTYPTKDRKGGDMNEWPKELQVREFPKINTERELTNV